MKGVYPMSMRLGLFLLSFYFAVPAAKGQETTDSHGVGRLDEAPWASTRAAGMSRAIGPLANGLEAPYFNPAGIGGLHDESDSRPAVTRLNIPSFAGAFTENASDLQSSMRTVQKLSDEKVFHDLHSIAPGERQYARLSLVPNIQLYRTFLAYSYDRQVSTVMDGGGDTVNLEERTATGPYGGFSLTAGERRIYFGLSVGYITRGVTSGSFDSSLLDDTSARREAFKEETGSYTGMPIHTGFLWHINRPWDPTLSLVARNVRHTKYQSSEGEELLVEEDLSLGFSLSPRLGEWVLANFVLEGTELTQDHSHLGNKIRAGMELNIGQRFGSEAGLSLRGGYSRAGWSYGLGLNARIIDLQVSSTAEDVGTDHQRVIERRLVASFAINVAAF